MLENLFYQGLNNSIVIRIQHRLLEVEVSVMSGCKVAMKKVLRFAWIGKLNADRSHGGAFELPPIRFVLAQWLQMKFKNDNCK